MQLRQIETDARDEQYLILQLHLGEGVTDYATAVRKRSRLQDEISQSHATQVEKDNMTHSLSKLWMFLAEFVPDRVKEEWAAVKASQDS